MEHDEFANVTWQNDEASHGIGSPIASPRDPQDGLAQHDEPQAGRNADAMDLAGVDDKTLECTVDQPIKESEGTKEAYVSYLVTTRVGYTTCHL